MSELFRGLQLYVQEWVRRVQVRLRFLINYFIHSELKKLEKGTKCSEKYFSNKQKWLVGNLFITSAT